MRATMSMRDAGGRNASRPAFKRLGLLVLIVALPIALVGIVASPNDYKSWGLDAVDCDGPFTALLFAVPGLLVYGAGAVLYGLQARKPSDWIAAVLCCLICLPLGANFALAVKEQSLNERIQETCR